MKFLRKKRVFALLLVSFIAFLFYDTDWIGRWLLYPVSYEQDIQVSAANYKVDPLLIATIIRVESNYRPELISKKGAVGLMQLMPDTAEWIVEKAGFSSETMDHLHNSDVNIEIGSWYLRSLFQQFNHYMEGQSRDDQFAIIAAAYNAGPGNTSKWLKGNVWDGKLETIQQIPFGETRHYIQRVVYYYKKYEQFYAEKWDDEYN